MHHLAFILTGFAVVMGILAFLWGVTALIGRIFTARSSPGHPAPSPVKPAAEPAQGPPAHHLAAIAAAVAVLTDGRGRVTSVTAMPHRAHAWAQHGRTEEFASHRVRWGWSVPGPLHTDRRPDAPSPSIPPSRSKDHP